MQNPFEITWNREIRVKPWDFGDFLGDFRYLKHLFCKLFRNKDLSLINCKAYSLRSQL